MCAGPYNPLIAYFNIFLLPYKLVLEAKFKRDFKEISSPLERNSGFQGPCAPFRLYLPLFTMFMFDQCRRVSNKIGFVIL